MQVMADLAIAVSSVGYGDGGEFGCSGSCDGGKGNVLVIRWFFLLIVNECCWKWWLW